MTASHFSGPLVSYGASNNSASTSTGANPEAGPSAFYQGDALLDPRYPYSPGVTGVAKVKAFGASIMTCALNATPQAKAAANIAALQHTVGGTAMTLVSAQSAAVSVNVPMIPYGSGSSGAVKVLALDLGIVGQGNCTINTKTITVVNLGAQSLIPGQKILVAAAATPQIVTVVSLSGTTLTVDTNIAATNSAAAIATLDYTDTGVEPYIQAGHARIYDPSQATARAVIITASNSSGAGGIFTVKGYDVYGVPMTETLTSAPGSALTVTGKKAFKYIASVTSDTTDATYNYSVGTTDIIGINLRADIFEYSDIYMAGALITANTGFVAAGTATTATAADTRGTYAVQTATDGSRRLIIYVCPTIQAVTRSTPTDSTLLFGVTQYA